MKANELIVAFNRAQREYAIKLHNGTGNADDLNESIKILQDIKSMNTNFGYKLNHYGWIIYITVTAI